MSNGYGANQYRQNNIKTANRGQILIMLYEAAVNYVKKATAALDQKDMAAKGQAIGKVHDIINELNSTLNFELGGNIARDLERLYNFMIEQLVKANATNTREPLLAVQKNLETLLDGWKKAVAEVNKTQGQAK